MKRMAAVRPSPTLSSLEWSWPPKAQTPPKGTTVQDLKTRPGAPNGEPRPTPPRSAPLRRSARVLGSGLAGPIAGAVAVRDVLKVLGAVLAPNLMVW